MDIPPAPTHPADGKDATEVIATESPAERELTVAVPTDAPELSPPAAARLLRLIRNVAVKSDYFAGLEAGSDDYGSRAA